MSALEALSERELETIAGALEDGRLGLPVSEFSLQRLLGRKPPPTLAEEVAALLRGGAAAALRMLARRRPAPLPELVWSGPDATHALRATAVVVEELFERARTRVLIAGFAIARGESVFLSLARRMDDDDQLQVRLVLNVHHNHRDTDSAWAIGMFADQFWKHSWPGERRPQVFYDPRSLLSPAERAVMHAKCVVVDGAVAFVTSANFTPHAQLRNVELGVLVEQNIVARQIEEQFDLLIERNHLLRLPG
jgi:phosphatidylserine/phosphatidylglycerophosphate/cardiolipin synthase-like enzyme